jgi:hypothetical protein
MKFIDYFERSRPTGVKLLLLGGEDDTLKNQLRLEFIKQNSGLQKEYSHIETVQGLTSSMEEGGFFGPRFFDVLFTGKVKSPALWNTFFDISSTSPHSMILCFVGEGGEWTDQTFKKYPGILWFDCKFPKNKRERTRIITFLLGYHKITLENPDLIKEISTRVKTSLELVNFLTCLKLLLEYQPKISVKDLRGLLVDSNQEELKSHNLMGGNIGKLVEEIEVREPIRLLTFWFSVLKGFYTWLSQDTGESSKPGKKDDDDDDDEDDEKDENSPSLNRYQLKEYGVAKHRYSLQLVREVMEELNSNIQDCLVGRQDLWKERAKITIQKMSIRA